ncbi:hypothetical protein GLW08_15405 [Pontibacillus yanchengensis]|uniref:Uncharacterized protein n=2 Tax=Pontibacillus yanchengensis TaxID=462910 RepID=A0ACC7VKK7_9BACI|nr:hypothetical protein [Pontibacillus yanchengensis]MYL34904.1 hypothetical protein [Pontibacillus yanchengensis]MYL54721.1 hypothetical protein [Pontibacillus yanchengensis]
MIHQLKRIEKSPNRRSSHKIVGISESEREEWLWTAFVKGKKVMWMFVSSRPLMLNGREVQWKGQETVPPEIESHVNQVAAQIGDLFKTVEVS